MSVLDSLVTKSEEHKNKIERQKRLELLDKFAMPILHGLLISHVKKDTKSEDMVQAAYIIAEKVLKHREQIT